MQLRIIFMFLLLGDIAVGAEPREADPYRYEWSREGSVAGLSRFFLDINGDNKPDLFLAATALVGMGGGNFSVYIVKGTRQYQYLGDIPIQPYTLEVLQSKHQGVHDLRGRMRHAGLPAGKEWVYVFDGKMYKGEMRKASKEKSIAPRVETVEKSGLELKWKP